MRTHELKTWTAYFQDIIDGKKKFEVRKDDRMFCSGDRLILREWDPQKKHYTGRETEVVVGYLMSGGRFGIEPGYIVLEIVPRFETRCRICGFAIDPSKPAVAPEIEFGMAGRNKTPPGQGERPDCPVEVAAPLRMQPHDPDPRQ